jgi:hypothetical protein
VLPQLELDGDFDDHVHGRAVPLRGREPPLAHGLDGALIESAIEPAPHTHVADRAVAPHDDFEQHFAADSAPPGVVGVIGFDFAQQSWRLDACARAERPSTLATA